MIKELKDYCEEAKIAINFFQKDTDIIEIQGLKKVLTKFLSELQNEEARRRIKK